MLILTKNNFTEFKKIKTIDFDKLKFTAVVQSGSGMADDGRLMFKPEHIMDESFEHKGELKLGHNDEAVIGSVKFFTKGKVTYANCELFDTPENKELLAELKDGTYSVSGEVAFFNADGSLMDKETYSTTTPEDKYNVFLYALAITKTPADEGAHIITTNFEDNEDDDTEDDSKDNTPPNRKDTPSQPDTKQTDDKKKVKPQPDKKKSFKKKFKKQFSKRFKGEFEKCMKDYSKKKGWNEKPMGTNFKKQDFSKELEEMRDIKAFLVNLVKTI